MVKITSRVFSLISYARNINNFFRNYFSIGLIQEGFFSKEPEDSPRSNFLIGVSSRIRFFYLLHGRFPRAFGVLEPLLASRLVTSKKKSPKGEDFFAANSLSGNELNPSIDSESLGTPPNDSTNEYVLLQQRIFKMTLVVSAIIGLLTIIFVDLNAAISLFLGAFSGIFYLRLLAKSIGSLGKKSTSVSKVQLLVPVLLILVVTKLPQLQLIPALVGFLLYKPSLILHFLFEPSSQS